MQAVQVAAMKRSFSKPQHEPQLERQDRRARGVFYTPAEIAEWIVEQTYAPLLQAWQGETDPPKLLDPACGAGVFLLAAERLLRERCSQLGLSETDQPLIVNRALHGIDIDAATIAWAGQHAKLQTANLHCADALASPLRDCFDAVVGNPPYVSIRELARNQTPEYVSNLRKRFRTAHGNFDLYVLFIERALELLKPGGRLGFIVPNKWATLDYASKLREMLLRETTLEQIIDLSTLRVFPQAGTYPQVIVLQRKPAMEGHQVRVSHVTHVCDLQPTKLLRCTRLISQASLKSRAFVLGNEIRVEDRVPTKPLESLATLHSGASGYSANLLAAALQEASNVRPEQQENAVDFIVSGNIDRYAISRGNVRFLNQTWQRPCLSLQSASITAAKARLYREPKIVLSGMCRRLEAAYDEQSCALGVQVYAAAELKVDPFYLLGVLNSKLLSYLFRERFGAKCLAGGYLSVNKGQLAQLPIAVDDREQRSLQNQIAKLARQMHSRVSLTPTAAPLEEKLDALVYQLYAVTTAEQQLIEESFATLEQKSTRKRAA
jgi:adenine-specific DNA-methyltransferase